MQLEEALTYRCMAKVCEKRMLEQCALKNEALFKTEVMSYGAPAKPGTKGRRKSWAPKYGCSEECVRR
jgi:hypothetical protein